MNSYTPEPSIFALSESTLPVIEKIAEVIPGGFFIYHADGDEELIYINNAMLRIFGCDTEEEFRQLTHNSFKGMVHPDDLETVEHSISRQIAADYYNMDYVEYRIIQKGGKIRWIEDYGHFITTKAYGDIFCVFINDATERLSKRLANLEEANTQLSKAYAKESQYRRAILQDALTFFEIDLTRDEFITSSAPIIKANLSSIFDFAEVPNFVKYSDYVKYVTNFLKDDERDKYLAFFDTARLRKCYEDGELEQIIDSCMIDKFGAERLLRHTILLGHSESTGDVIALSVTKDITDIMERGRLLEAAWKQAEIASIARVTFLNNMSHDIRTPLNGIMGYTELMLRYIDEPDKLRQYIQKIRVAGEQLQTIWDNALAITHTESKKLVLKEDKCDLHDILAELSQRCFLHKEAKQIDFVEDTADIKHHLLIADHDQLREILWQILDNAFKYTAPGGRVEFSAQELPNITDDYGRYQFIIRDNGIGIGADFMQRIFQPFERERNTTQGGIHGTGLGLSVAKNLIDLMGGSITVESMPEEGSVFTVNLTLKLQEADTISEAAVQPGEHHIAPAGKRVLLVEDNEINREIAEELLTEVGFKVDSVADGSLAVEKVKSEELYDIILMDIQMPVMDGYAATRAIRELSDERRAAVPIIALTADMFSETQEKALQCGMNAHCAKPLNMDNLCSIIDQLLSDK